MRAIQHLLRNTLLLFLTLTASLAFAEPDIDKPAPAFRGKTADGKSIDLASLKGKTVVLEWTNHECPFVRKHYESGNIPQIQKQATKDGIVWLQVISSAPGKEGFVDGATAAKLNSERGSAPTATILDSDGSIGKLYGAKTSPHLFIIDASGLLVYKGGIDSIPSADKDDIAKAENYVKSALNELSAGKKISKASTKAYGCAVKYAS
ncbi:redoxin domain-containing protein [Methyloterricola oryzae]|uniref:redoxin domain-containing protein n=1 Tax=Methyloterricola oryzae TaxID=1495050 RepID=UPI0005EB2322|nr:redoxin domain-containing protein [Methyloterricola oryzae]